MIEFDPILVHEWLARTVRRMPEKEAIICGPQRWTYRKVAAYSDYFAESLIDLGMGRQDRVVIMTGNRPETVGCLYGALKAGCVFVVLSDVTKARRLRHVLGNCGAGVLVALRAQANVVEQALDGLGKRPKVIYVEIDRKLENSPTCPATGCDLSPPTIFSQDRHGPVISDGRLPRCLDVDLACLIYTSASTGEPKGVMCTHHNMIAAARSIIQYIGNRENDVILNALPLSFDYGLYQVVMTFMFGGTVVLEKSFLYLHNILTMISKEGVTGFPVVPTMVAMLLRMRSLEKYDLGSLRYITNTGASLPVEHIRRLRLLLPHVKIFSMFGLTECKRVSYLRPEELEATPSAVGRAMPNCEVSVVDEDGNGVAPGELGELVIRGSNVMQGYWGDPALTARVYRDGGYPAARELHSGDYFRQDERGVLYFAGRMDDMIKTGGQRVSPKEVENAICMLKGVAEAAVVGVPDEILGEAIRVFIVRDGAKLTSKNVLKYCAENLEPLMVPKYVEFVSGLPRTLHGKLDRKKLRAWEKQAT